MKKHFNTVVIAILMAVLMAALSPVQAFAASTKHYISEIRMADSAEKLEELGYTVLDKDLNAGGNEGFTYIGYKTTTNPEEAITDISIMDMKGGYSFGDYEAILEQQTKAVTERLSTYRIAIDEFRERYHGGSKAALMAFESLNGYIEDDSGKLIGDMLIAPDLSDEDLIKLFMQGTIIINSAIADCLAIGLARDSENNWLSRIADNENNAPDAFDDAVILIEAAGNIRSTMQKYLDSGLKLEDRANSPELFDDYTSDELIEFGEGGILYETLSIFEYKNGTVADLFMSESVSPQEFYPLVAALTPGQLAIAEICGFKSLIKAAVVSDDLWDEAKEYSEDIVADAYGDSEQEKISVYTGVDRDMYNGGVALTSDAKRKSASTGDSDWWHGNVSLSSEITMYSIAGASAILVAVGYGTFSHYAGINAAIKSAIASSANVLNRMMSLPASNFTPQFIAQYSYIQSSSEAFAARQSAALAFSGRMAIIAQVAMWISAAIICLMVGIYFGVEIYNYYNPEYTEIPLILMDLKFGEDDDIGDWEKYVKYNAVLNEGGSAGDLNGFAGKQWNAMYVTKDRVAGNPIEADSFTVQYGDSATPRNYQPVHYFGAADAFNLNSHCYNDDLGGIFMFFRSDDEAFASETASVFGSGAFSVVTGIGGLIIGALGAAFVLKKKLPAKA